MQPFLEPTERLILIRDGFYAEEPAVRRRASMILELDGGSNFMRAARSAKCHRDTVKYWYHRYLERRSPSALRRAGDAHRRYEDHLNHAARARALVLLAETRTDRRLPWSDQKRAEVEHEARFAAHPVTRYRQALRLAVDRGISTSLIARAASCRRSGVSDLRELETTGVSRWRRRAAAKAGAGPLAKAEQGGLE
jgi:hypothetical protein